MSKKNQPVSYVDVLRGSIVLDRMLEEIKAVYFVLLHLMVPHIEKIFEARGSEPIAVHVINTENSDWRVLIYHTEKSRVMEIDFISNGILAAELKEDAFLMGVSHIVIPEMHKNLQALLDGLMKIAPGLSDELAMYQTLGSDLRFLQIET